MQLSISILFDPVIVARASGIMGVRVILKTVVAGLEIVQLHEITLAFEFLVPLLCKWVNRSEKPMYNTYIY